MPRLLTMATIRQRCQRRADMENSSHIVDAEWNALISEKYGELHGLVCEAGLRYFESTSTITATGAASYSEPSDQLAFLWIDKTETDGTRTRLRRATPQDIVTLSGLTGDAICYEFIDDKIYLYPNPSSGTYQLIYVPQATDLSSYADADLVDVVTPDGEAFLIWGVSILAKSKSESDVTLALQREEAARQRLMAWTVNRAMAEPGVRPDPDWGPLAPNYYDWRSR